LLTTTGVEAELKVYNGGSTSSPLVFHIFLKARDSKVFNFGDGIFLDKGIYLGSFNRIGGVLVRWEI